MNISGRLMISLGFSASAEHAHRNQCRLPFMVVLGQRFPSNHVHGRGIHQKTLQCGYAALGLSLLSSVCFAVRNKSGSGLHNWVADSKSFNGTSDSRACNKFSERWLMSRNNAWCFSLRSEYSLAICKAVKINMARLSIVGAVCAHCDFI